MTICLLQQCQIDLLRHPCLFGNGAPQSDRGLCPLRFGSASLAHIATFLPLGLIEHAS